MTPETPTPETDAFKRTVGTAWHDFAEKLERERDAARAEVEAMREAIREANATLEDWELLWKEQAGLVSSRAFSDGRPVSKASIGARSKLQPFLKP